MTVIACFQAFLNNNWVGCALFLGIVGDTLADMSALLTGLPDADLRVRLQDPAEADGVEVTRLMRDSRHFHHPWVSAPCDLPAWRRFLDRVSRPNEAGFLIRRRDDEALCGVVNLNIITYEALCSAYLSYYARGPDGRSRLYEGRPAAAHSPRLQ